ncbi:hypothetical protein HZS55_04185 [Halosimplex rubrum]|uniref:DUF4935 domain-containing protein n=1 Tax=Halosimplex rubrum TaxID=869889 RepID=A0A7D5T340_9EURY|nr:hypothetical protein [Halosimplex rubrum]QLH76550.1 hypothetical protein HZS55_04185 [Halosimplex rubrum]
MSSTSPKIFFDNSVLSDYCRIYADNHEYANKVFSEYDGEVWVGEFGEERFDEETSNRQRLFSYLKDEISGRISSHSSLSGEEVKEEIREEVLDVDRINSSLLFPIKENHTDIIEHVCEELERKSPKDLLEEIRDLSRAARTLESNLKRTKIDERQPRRPEPLFRAMVVSHVENEIQAKNVVDAVFWSRETGGEHILIRNSDDGYQNRDGVNAGIETKMSHQDQLEIESPKSVVTKLSLQ